MQYFTNVELAKLYAVSEGTVRRWIRATLAGKLDLRLFEHGGKRHIANTTSNRIIMDTLAANGKKHRNARWHTAVAPQPGFYERYDRRQVLDIIRNIDIYREIPLQYGYIGAGADYWDAYAQRLWEEPVENGLTATIELLQSNLQNICRLIGEREQVNVIDLGVGNALPVKELLTSLLYERGVLGRYIGVDISPQMLDIAKRNIQQWFEGRVRAEWHRRDITSERFDDLAADENVESSVNLVLLLGGTLNNFRTPGDALRIVAQSINRGDLLISSTKLDTDETRRFFDFHSGKGPVKLADYQDGVLRLLNINKTMYEIEQLYDEQRRVRVIRIRFTRDITLSFDLGSYTRHIELRKDERLLLWRAWHQDPASATARLERSGFTQLEVSTTADRQYLLSISELTAEE